MICIDAEQLQDGLYNIKDGKIYKYKAKGGTVRTYKLENRPQGEWIYTNNPLRLNDEWKCNRCGNISFVETNYCPNCGAKMKQ